MNKHKSGGFAAVAIIALLIVSGVIVAAVLFVKQKQSTKKSTENQPVATVDTSHPKQFIQADFIDLSKIYTISKFRSAEGHDFSGGGETCRSMKHYFYPQQDASTSMMVKANNGIPPGPDGKTDIDIFSPVDGTLTQIQSERFPVGEQFYIVPDNAKDYTIRLFHVYKSDGIAQGARLKAGQKIGVISKASATDIAIEVGQKNYVSYFSVMPDTIFAAYQTRGIETRDDVILSKAYRDAHAVPCNQDKQGDQAFYLPDGYDKEADDVRLTGYVPFDPSTMNTNMH